jgi:hypothetical protein
VPVIKIDTNNCIPAERRRPLFKLGKRNITRFAKLLLISTRAPADNVPHLRKNIAKDIRPKDSLTHDDAVIGGDALALN